MILITQDLLKDIILIILISSNRVYILFQENKLNLSCTCQIAFICLNIIPSATAEKYVIKASGY